MVCIKLMVPGLLSVVTIGEFFEAGRPVLCYIMVCIKLMVPGLLSVVTIGEFFEAGRQCCVICIV